MVPSHVFHVSGDVYFSTPFEIPQVQDAWELLTVEKVKKNRVNLDSGDSWIYPDPNVGPPMGNPCISPIYWVYILMGYNPQESLENTKKSF